MKSNKPTSNGGSVMHNTVRERQIYYATGIMEILAYLPAPIYSVTENIPGRINNRE